ncbi:MAG TPA: hypothetical protein VFZ19_01415 [Solirubrobacterales bacterium]
MFSVKTRDTLHSGPLIAVDGCSGVGKTTLVAELASRLGSLAPVCRVKLPSSGPLGRLARELLEQEAHDAVALAAAADRALVAESTILPAIQEGQATIIDRYVLSALALNALSGLPHEFSYALCSRLPRPDLSVHVFADPTVTRARLRDRDHLDHYERAELKTASDERAALERSAHFLSARGWNIVPLDVTSLTPSQASEHICGLLEGSKRRRSEKA